MIAPDRRAFLSATAAFGLSGCVSVDVRDSAAAAPAQRRFRPAPPLAAIDARPERIMAITVCLRPFRAAGPRLDVETVGDKRVVHNYGHGGSGWSLAWGSGLIAVRRALEGGTRDVAVIGCGALGLAAATLAQRAGARVTIYAKDRMPEVRSAGATGMWSPDSRIALSSAVDAGFPALWERMARDSFRWHQRYLGLADAPVAYMDNYMLADGPSTGGGGGHSSPGFVYYGARVRDLLPASEPLEPGQHPFPARLVRKSVLPMFNITQYGRVLMNDFLIGGGVIVTREFHSPSELASLPQRAIINCTGYGARALWKDESIVPVRGQLAWLIPQPEVTYGLYYRGVGVVPRRDGLIVQQTGTSESWGYNDANETPSRAEAEDAVRTIGSVFAPRERGRG